MGRRTHRVAVERLESRSLLAGGLPRPDHVVVVIEENHAYANIIGSSAAPYINQLANQGALMSDAHAIEHPSQPNYLDFFSGSNQGVTDDTQPPAGAPYSTANLGAGLLQAGLTFGGYSQSEPSVGYLLSKSPYVRKHNPWSDWQGSTANAIPAADNMPFTSFPTDYSTLPTVSFVVPDTVHDMHDGTDPSRITTADTWLQQNLSGYVAWMQTHNSMLLVTMDEGDHDPDGSNHIPVIFDGPMVVPGVYGEHTDHYGILRTVEDLYNLPYAGASAAAAPIADIWTGGTQQATLGHFTIGYASPVAHGTPQKLTVRVYDTTGALFVGYTGTIHFTSSDPSAVLPADYTFTAADGGVHTFQGVTLYTVGTQTITVVDVANGKPKVKSVSVT